VSLLESNDDTLVFERAFIGKDDEGNFTPLCSFSGILCELAADKPSTLDIGFVGCWPLDSNLVENWPLSVTLEKRTTDGDSYTEELPGCTGNVRAVAAVKHFLTLVESGQAQVGMTL
jgi:hypothetical protein